MALARRHPAQPGSAGDAPASCPRPLAARGGRCHDGLFSVTRPIAPTAALVLVLAGCATLDKPPATLEARKPPPGLTQAASGSAPPPAPAPPPAAPGPPNRLAAG